MGHGVEWVTLCKFEIYLKIEMVIKQLILIFKDLDI